MFAICGGALWHLTISVVYVHAWGAFFVAFLREKSIGVRNGQLQEENKCIYINSEDRISCCKLLANQKDLLYKRK